MGEVRVNQNRRVADYKTPNDESIEKNNLMHL